MALRQYKASRAERRALRYGRARPEWAWLREATAGRKVVPFKATRRIQPRDET